MVVKTSSSPFGGQARTRALIALRLLGSTYARELARVLDAPLSGVQRALLGLERDGLVVGRAVGRTRPYELNPTYFAREELQRFLMRLSEPERTLRGRIERLRRRPRQTGKALGYRWLPSFRTRNQSF